MKVKIRKEEQAIREKYIFIQNITSLRLETIISKCHNGY